MKKVLCSFLIGLFLLGTLFSTTYAATKVVEKEYIVDGKKVLLPSVDILIDGKKVDVPQGDVTGVILKDRTLIPIRIVSEKTGAKVGWDAKTKEVKLSKDNKNIVLKVGSSTVLVDGVKKNLPGNVPAKIISDRTMVPLRFVSEELGYEVGWDSKTRVASLSKKNVDKEVPGSLFEEEKPQEPSKPVEKPQEPSKPVEKPEIPVQVSLDEVKYNLESRTQGDLLTINRQAKNGYKSFFLENPSRLVFDIEKSKLNSTMLETQMFNSSFVSSINSFYYQEDGHLRIVLTLGSEFGKDNVKVYDDGTNIKVETKIVEQQINENALKYTSDRINSKLQVELRTKEQAQILSQGNGNVTFTVSKKSYAGTLNGLQKDDRFISGVKIRDLGEKLEFSMDLKDRVTAYISKDGSQGSVVVDFKKEFRSRPLIVVDAGHGGHDSGAVSKINGAKEKDLTLAISNKLVDRLSANGYEVIYTRNTDEFIELKNRARKANEPDADIFISVHINQAGGQAALGIETLYYPTDDNKELAKMIQEELINASGAKTRGVKERPELVVLNSTRVPAVLLELGFLSNPDEVSKLVDDSYQNILVDGVVRGVQRYLGSR